MHKDSNKDKPRESTKSVIARLLKQRMLKNNEKVPADIERDIEKSDTDNMINRISKLLDAEPKEEPTPEPRKMGKHEREAYKKFTSVASDGGRALTAHELAALERYRRMDELSVLRSEEFSVVDEANKTALLKKKIGERRGVGAFHKAFGSPKTKTPHTKAVRVDPPSSAPTSAVMQMLNGRKGWYNPTTNEYIKVSAFHVGEVVKSPEKFGFSHNKIREIVVKAHTGIVHPDQMDQHIEGVLKDISSGWKDTFDPIEHAANNNGWVRVAVSGSNCDMSTTSKREAQKVVKDILPYWGIKVKDAMIDIATPKDGVGAYIDSVTISDENAAKRFIGQLTEAVKAKKTAPTKTKQLRKTLSNFIQRTKDVKYDAKSVAEKPVKKATELDKLVNERKAWWNVKTQKMVAVKSMNHLNSVVERPTSFGLTAADIRKAIGEHLKPHLYVVTDEEIDKVLKKMVLNEIDSAFYIEDLAHSKGWIRVVNNPPLAPGMLDTEQRFGFTTTVMDDSRKMVDQILPYWGNYFNVIQVEIHGKNGEYGGAHYKTLRDLNSAERYAKG